MRKQLCAVWLTCSLALAGISSAAAAAEVFPTVHGETLSGKGVVLPEAIKGRPAILILSFSRAAQEQTKAWGERLKAQKVAAEYFQLLELEDVPRLFRGAVKSGIKKGIPPASYESFILLFEGQDALKKVVGFQKSPDAYVLLLDGRGNIVWREQGPVSDENIDKIVG